MRQRLPIRPHPKTLRCTSRLYQICHRRPLGSEKRRAKLLRSHLIPSYNSACHATSREEAIALEPPSAALGFRKPEPFRSLATRSAETGIQLQRQTANWARPCSAAVPINARNIQCSRRALPRCCSFDPRRTFSAAWKLKLQPREHPPWPPLLHHHGKPFAGRCR